MNKGVSDVQGSGPRDILTDQSPVLFDPPRQRNLLPDLCAGRRRQLDLCEIGLHAQDTSPCRCRTDIDEEQFVLHEFRHLGLFPVLGFYS